MKNFRFYQGEEMEIN